VKTLSEEGSTAVFPTILREVRDDLTSVETSLARAETGKITQLVQSSIEKNLEDLIEALKNERTRPKKGGSGGGGGGGGGDKQPLVPPIAELKMLKMLQTNLYQRTRLIDAVRAGKPRLSETELKEVATLSERQKKAAVMTEELKEKLQQRQQESMPQTEGDTRP
jgi:hypothetical protein